LYDLTNDLLTGSIKVTNLNNVTMASPEGELVQWKKY
jgi:hypothetical protein